MLWIAKHSPEPRGHNFILYFLSFLHRLGVYGEEGGFCFGVACFVFSSYKYISQILCFDPPSDNVHRSTFSKDSKSININQTLFMT